MNSGSARPSRFHLQNLSLTEQGPRVHQNEVDIFFTPREKQGEISSFLGLHFIVRAIPRAHFKAGLNEKHNLAGNTIKYSQDLKVYDLIDKV